MLRSRRLPGIDRPLRGRRRLPDRRYRPHEAKACYPRVPKTIAVTRMVAKASAVATPTRSSNSTQSNTLPLAPVSRPEPVPLWARWTVAKLRDSHGSINAMIHASTNTKATTAPTMQKVPLKEMTASCSACRLRARPSASPSRQGRFRGRSDNSCSACCTASA